MAKLFFKQGVMGAAKSADALMVKFRYEEIGQRCLFCKTRLDTRDGARVIKSRIGLIAEDVMFLDEILAMTENVIKEYDVIICDEAQFATKEQIDGLADIVDNLNIPVICYGLKTDFRGEFFEGSKRLFEIADKVEEIKQICWCGKKALFNARILNGRVVKYGEQIDMGGNEKYVALCRKHYNMRVIEPSCNDIPKEEQSDLIIKLPCAEGTLVYCVGKENCIQEKLFDRTMVEDFGKTIFLTIEEAREYLHLRGYVTTVLTKL